MKMSRRDRAAIAAGKLKSQRKGKTPPVSRYGAKEASWRSQAAREATRDSEGS